MDDLKADTPNAIAMGPFGSRIRTENFVSDGVPVIRGNNLGSERFVDDGFVYLTEDKANELRSANAFAQDIVITHRGTLGQVGIIPQTARYPRYVVSQSQLKVTIDPQKADPYFVFYYLRSPEGTHQLLANASQTGVPAIASPSRAVRAIQVPCPPLDEQRAIASILGVLDDKIELNRQMSETLEAVARALFKSWFVDFDPVRAKVEGRWKPGQTLPGLPSHLYDLFPDQLVASELGPIPAGWEVGTLGDIAHHPRRGAKPEEIDANMPYVGLEHIPRGTIALRDWGRPEGIQSNKFRFKAGEILFGKLRPYLHKVVVAPIEGVCSTDIVVIAPQGETWFGLVLGHVASVQFVNHADASSNGTKMPRTSWPDMARFEVVLPPERVVRLFTELTRPMIDRIIAGGHEARTLASVRDALLPMLISGELRVKDAERFLEERAL